jgi:hypothetical protein
MNDLRRNLLNTKQHLGGQWKPESRKHDQVRPISMFQAPAGNATSHPQFPWRMVVLLAALGLMAFTGRKIYKMAQIRGLQPGAISSEVIVTQKGHTGSLRRGREDSYWVAWREKGERQSSAHTLSLRREEWEPLQEGDTIAVVYLPGDPEPHIPDGIYVEWGNFAIDFVLLAGELGVVVVMTWQLLRGRRGSAVASSA